MDSNGLCVYIIERVLKAERTPYMIHNTPETGLDRGPTIVVDSLHKVSI